MADTETIFVRSGRADARVVLSERDPRHPGGEAYVAGDEAPSGDVNHPIVEVARTEAVEAKLRGGELVVVERPSKAEREAAQEAAERLAEAVPPVDERAVDPDGLTPEGRAQAAEFAAAEAREAARAAEGEARAAGRAARPSR